MNDVGLGIFAFLVELAGIHQLAVYFENLDQAVKNVLPIIGLIVCVYGLLQCFLGYKLFKFWCGVVGLFVGILIGDAIATSGVLSNTPGAYLIALLIILFLGLIGAFVAYRAYMVGLFLYAFAAAFTVVFYIIFLVFGSPLAGMLIGIIAGVAMGVVAVVFKRFWIIVSTCIYGGVAICIGMMMVLLTVELGWFFILPPVFVISGFIIQQSTAKKKKKADTAVHHVYATSTPTPYPADVAYPPETPPGHPQSVPQAPPAEPYHVASPAPVETVAAPESEVQ